MTDAGARKHGLHRSRPGAPARIDPLDQVGNIPHFILRRILRLQPISPLLLTEAPLGVVRFVLCAAAPHRRGRLDRHLVRAT